MPYFFRKKILITGADDFLGKELVKILVKQGARMKDIHKIPSSFKLDDKKILSNLLKNCNIVIHLASNSGGISYNSKKPGSIFYDNAIMGVNLIEESRRAKVSRLCLLGSACSYPLKVKTPFREEDIWSGLPDKHNFSYGMAKRVILAQSLTYRRQYNFDSINIIPANIYGPREDEVLENAHVVPALIYKYLLAKVKKVNYVKVWGSGNATRDFLYVKDAALGICKLIEMADGSSPINLGSGKETTIRKLCLLIARITGFKGITLFDDSMPEGQQRRILNIEKMIEITGYRPKTKLEVGIRKTLLYLKRKFFNPLREIPLS